MNLRRRIELMETMAPELPRKPHPASLAFHAALLRGAGLDKLVPLLRKMPKDHGEFARVRETLSIDQLRLCEAALERLIAEVTRGRP